MKSDGSIDCRKCSLIRKYNKINAKSTTIDFIFYDSRGEYLFRTCSVATSLVTSLILLLVCRAVVNTERFRNHSSVEHSLLSILVITELFGNHKLLLVRMRSKLVVLLVSPHFQRVKTNELSLIRKK